jgi:hypothetical protein
MWHRTLFNLLAGSVLCLGLGACDFDEIDDGAAAPTFSIGGTVAGSTGPIALQNSNGTHLIVTTDGSFTFETPMVPSALYNVTVVVPPKSQACTVINGAGTVGTTDIRDVNVVCAPIAYMLTSR